MPLSLTSNSYTMILPGGETLTFKRPSTTDRLRELERVRVELKSDLEKAENWQEFNKLAQKIASEYLSDAAVMCDGKPVTEIVDWRELLVADALYGQYLEGFFNKFFRPTSPPEVV